MKYHNHAGLPGWRSAQRFIVAVVLLGAIGSLEAQDSMVALGQIGFDGAVVNSDNTVGGVVSATFNGLGDYDVEITAPGAFTGSFPAQFIVEATPTASEKGNRWQRRDLGFSS